MSIYDYTIDKEYAAELDQAVCAAYPKYADEARTFMNKILRRCDKQKFLVFNGEAYDRDMSLGVLSCAHHLVCDLLQHREEGWPVPDWYLENAMRRSLGLGFTLIDGGAH